MARIWLVFFALLSFSVQGAGRPWDVTSIEPHKVKIFNLGTTALQVRLDMIERAQESIVLEYFIYDTDPSARILTQALVRKAEQGVKVRILVDAFMVKPQLDPFHIFFLEQKGVEVKYYHDTTLWRFVKYQYRNHRKLLSIDSKEAIIGGRNIADEYFDIQPEYNFVDQDIWIEGPLVEQINASFDEFWEHELSSKPKRPKAPELNDFAYRVRTDEDFDWSRRIDPYDRFASRAVRAFENDFKSWRKKSRDGLNFLIESEEDRELLAKVRESAEESWEREPEGECKTSRFVSDEPGWGRKYRKKKHLNFALLERMKLVERKLTIDSPYFIPESKYRKVLKKLLENDVKIDVFTNSLHSTDAVYVNAAFNSVVKKYLKRGLTAWIYRGAAMEDYPLFDEKAKTARWGTHAKAYAFDDREIAIGTYNFDARSGIWNMEMSFFCDGDLELVKKFQDNIDWKKEHAHKITNKKQLRKVKFEKITFLKGVLYYFIKPLSLLLRNLL